MKKAILFLAAFLGTAAVKADNTSAPANESAARDQRVKDALETLINEGVVSESANECLKVDQSLLDQLKSEGTVKSSEGATPQTICVILK